MDGIWLKRAWGGKVQTASVLMAIGVNRECPAWRREAGKTGKAGAVFLRYLKERGLERIRLLVSDKSLGLLEASYKYHPDARWQRCIVHSYRNAQRVTPRGKIREVSLMLKAIHAQKDKESVWRNAEKVARKLWDLRLERAARLVCES